MSRRTVSRSAGGRDSTNSWKLLRDATAMTSSSEAEWSAHHCTADADAGDGSTSTTTRCVLMAVLRSCRSTFQYACNVLPMTSTPETFATRPPGRPRNSRADDAILAATEELVLQVGYDGLTVEAVANLAGVGRPTVYR